MDVKLRDQFVALWRRYFYLEKDSERPRAVLGLFDVSARPHVLTDVFTFSVPILRLPGGR